MRLIQCLVPLRPLPPTSTLFPYTTLFRSAHRVRVVAEPVHQLADVLVHHRVVRDLVHETRVLLLARELAVQQQVDRKSTRLNSSHLVISYAVFCLKKKKTIETTKQDTAAD